MFENARYSNLFLSSLRFEFEYVFVKTEIICNLCVQWKVAIQSEIPREAASSILENTRSKTLGGRKKIGELNLA